MKMFRVSHLTAGEGKHFPQSSVRPVLRCSRKAEVSRAWAREPGFPWEEAAEHKGCLSPYRTY